MTEKEAEKLINERGWHQSNGILFAPFGRGNKDKKHRYIVPEDEREALHIFYPGGPWIHGVRHGLNFTGIWDESDPDWGKPDARNA